ncbi:MAG TPA: PAS domain S-box protein, partial [Planctomycetota bacterium]|nr:PAS domain S-box protein [Planctomycetota bacterium]
MPPASDQHIAEIERRRAEAVRSLGILDTPDDVAFDELARLAADLAGTPMAAINFVDADRQWLKASIGFPRREFPRSFGFCPTVVDGGVALVVEDAAVEPRRPGAEAALGFGVRFYAGAPIRDAHGRTLGVVCVADGAPRRVDAERVERGLRAVAAQVLRLLELRRHVSLLQEATDARARAVEKLASYRSVLDGAVDACCLLDVDGRFVEQNAAHRRLLGYDDADLVDAFFAPVDPQVARAIRMDLATEGAFRGETECLAKDGRKVPVDLAVFVVRDASGAPVRLAAMLRDLSRRREAESRLRESEERFRSAFERAPVGMTITALDGRLLRVNEAFRRFLGRSEEELCGRSFESITHPDFLPQNLDHVRRLLDGVVEAFSMEKLYLRGDGVPVWGEVTVAMIRDADGAPLHLLAQVVDVDARKRAEARLSEARDRLEERVAERTAALEKAVAELRVEVAERKRVEEALRASEAQLVQSQKMEALGRLAGGVAHEFNNLLTVIVGHAELLTASGGTTDAEPILEAARRASAVTTRLLAFSRHQPAKPEVIDVDRVIRRQLEFLQPVLG